MAQTIGARIAKIARRENGNHACDHGGYFTSCVNHDPHEEWCADFAKWIWSQARVLHTDILTPGAGSFGEYGRKYGSGLHKKPRVGDAVLFNYDGESYADHVAIVVRVFSDGNIASIGGNEVTGNYNTSYVHRDVYSGATGYSTYWHYSITGYVSPVEDDLPYTNKVIRGLVKKGVAAELSAGNTKEEILGLVKRGVEAELKAGIGTSGITLAQGAQAAVDAQRALSRIGRQLTALTNLVKALPPAAPSATGTGDDAAVAEGADEAAQPA